MYTISIYVLHICEYIHTNWNIKCAYIYIYIRNLCVCVSIILRTVVDCSSRLHFMSVIFYSSTVIWQSSLLFPPWNVTVVLALQPARPSQTWKIPIKECRNISNSAVWGTVFNNCTCKHQGIQRTVWYKSVSAMLPLPAPTLQAMMPLDSSQALYRASASMRGGKCSCAIRRSINQSRAAAFTGPWLHCPWWAHRPPSTPQTWNGVENCHRLCSFGFPPGRLLWRPQQWYNGFLRQRAAPHGAVYGASHIDSQLLQKHIFVHMMCPQKWEARKLSDWLQFCWKWMWMWLFQVSYISLWSGAFACTCWDTFDPYLLGASCEK